jgi:hypothetical protein
MSGNIGNYIALRQNEAKEFLLHDSGEFLRLIRLWSQVHVIYGSLVWSGAEIEQKVYKQLFSPP